MYRTVPFICQGTSTIYTPGVTSQLQEYLLNSKRSVWEASSFRYDLGMCRFEVQYRTTGIQSQVTFYGNKYVLVDAHELNAVICC